MEGNQSGNPREELVSKGSLSLKEGDNITDNTRYCTLTVTMFNKPSTLLSVLLVCMVWNNTESDDSSQSNVSRGGTEDGVVSDSDSEGAEATSSEEEEEEYFVRKSTAKRNRVEEVHEDTDSDAPGMVSGSDSDSDRSADIGGESDSDEEQAPNNSSNHCKKAMASDKHWHEAREACKQHYVNAQSVPAQGTLCRRCGISLAVIRCLDCNIDQPTIDSGKICGEGGLLCGNCDHDVHGFAHFHRRQDTVKGFWRPVPSYREFDDATQQWTDNGALFRPSCDTSHIHGGGVLMLVVR